MRISDWSSDVCSSDLGRIVIVAGVEVGKLGHDDLIAARLVIGLRSMVPNGYGNAGKEGVQLGVALVGIGSGDDRRGGRILGFDTVDQIGRASGRERVCQYV